MIAKRHINITLIILLFISIGINFLKGMESINNENIDKKYNIEYIFRSKRVTEINYYNDILIIKTDKLLESYKVSPSQLKDVQSEAKRRGLRITYAKTSKPPKWLTAFVNWGPFTLFIFLLLLGVNLSGRFKSK